MEKIKIQNKINIRLLTMMAVSFVAWSCEIFQAEQGKTRIARVNESYLYLEDLENLVLPSTNPKDSTAMIEAYINRWATQQLLLDQAKMNLPYNIQKRFEKMIKEYERNLFIEAYKNTYLVTQLDSTINETDIQEFYEQNKENFHLNNELLKVRYVSVNKDYSRIKEVKESLERFNLEDKEELSRKSYQYKQINLNDSVWVKKDILLAEFPILKEKEEELKKANFIELQDSIGVYLLKVEDRLERNDLAPLPFIEPTIRQILLNSRKLELTKKLEKDITRDAIKHKKFQTYIP